MSGVIIESARATRVRTTWDAAGMGLLAALVCFAFSWVPSVWYDEAATILSSTRDWDDLFRMLRSVDAVHGLYYSGMHLWFELVGYTPLTLRLPSAIFAGLATGATVALVARLGSRRFALFAGAVLILLPRFTLAGTEGRSYSLTALLCVAMTGAFVAAIRSEQTGSRAGWVAYGVIAGLSILVFLYLALVVAAHLVTMLWLRRWRLVGKDALLGFALTAVVALVSVAPFALLVVSQSGQLDWISPLSPDTIFTVLVTQFFPGNVVFAALGGFLAVAGIVLLLRRRASGPEIADRDGLDLLAPLLLPILVLPTVALLLVSFVLPIYSPRYPTFATPALAVAIAFVLSSIRSWRVALGVLGLLVLVAAPTYITQRLPQGKQSDWAAVAEQVRMVDLAHPGERVGIVWGGLARYPLATARTVSYAYPTVFEGMTDLTLEESAADAGTLWERSRPLDPRDLDDLDAVWFVASDLPSGRSAIATIRGAGFGTVEYWHFFELDVVRLSRQ